MEISKIKKEQAFHDDRFGKKEDPRDSVTKYYLISERTRERYRQLIYDVSAGKHLLELGCGKGETSLLFLRNGAKVAGIDISPEGLQKAKSHTFEFKNDVDFLVMDAENTGFENDSFDVVVGAGIIHHLDIDRSYSEIQRVLNKGGHAIFIEPLGHNPIINLYRKFTPNLRTEDEHPLMMKEIKKLRSHFRVIKNEYFSLCTLLAVPFRASRYFRTICNILGEADNLLFKLPFLRKYAWTVVIHVSEPIK